MANYRRNFVPGGTFFFTVNLADRRRALLIEHIALLRAAVRHVRARHPFIIEAAVIGAYPEDWAGSTGDPIASSGES